jgi:hypothetical protein
MLARELVEMWWEVVPGGRWSHAVFCYPEFNGAAVGEACSIQTYRAAYIFPEAKSFISSSYPSRI